MLADEIALDRDLNSLSRQELHVGPKPSYILRATELGAQAATIWPSEVATRCQPGPFTRQVLLLEQLTGHGHCARAVGRTALPAGDRFQSQLERSAKMKESQILLRNG